jgi:hypothetical protein
LRRVADPFCSGVIGGIVTYYVFQIEGISLGSVVAGSILLPGIWFGGSISFGYSLMETLKRRFFVFSIAGGAVMGSLFGLLLGILLKEQQLQRTVFGFLYGAGIAMGVHIGRQFNDLLKILVWGVVGALFGCIAVILLGLGIDTLPNYILVSAGVTLAIGLSSSRFQ